MKASLRESVSEEAKERVDGAVAAINRLEVRFAEVRQMMPRPCKKTEGVVDPLPRFCSTLKLPNFVSQCFGSI